MHNVFGILSSLLEVLFKTINIADRFYFPFCSEILFLLLKALKLHYDVNMWVKMKEEYLIATLPTRFS